MSGLALAYGREPLWLEEGVLPGRVTVGKLPLRPALSNWEDQARHLLRHPLGTAPLRELARGRNTVALIVGDQYREGPKMALIRLIRQELGHLSAGCFTVFLANGTHAAFPLEASGLAAADLAGMEVVNHDGRADAELEYLGLTRRGTPVLLNRRYMDCELKVSLGQVKPHYFAGVAGGAKGVFPGLGGHRSIILNHRMKTDPAARFGVLDGNPVREEFEEIAALAGHDFILDVAVNEDGEVADLTAGHFVQAHRSLAERSIPWWRLEQPHRYPVVLVSDPYPVTKNLYQACKLLAVAGPLVEPGGTIVLAAECPEGTGPIEAVNHRIFEDGIKPLLPEGVQILILSRMSAPEVATTSFGTHLADQQALREALLARHGAATEVLVLPKAGNVMPVITGESR